MAAHDEEKASMNIPRIAISQCFESVQGEGVLVGYPTLFIRTQGCHVGCAWCDTKYSWKVRDKHIHKSADFAANILERLKGRDLWVDITGGEPLEQIDAVVWLVEKLHRSGHTKISFETAGIPLPDTQTVIDLFNMDVFFSLSPKLPSALGRRFGYEAFEAICQFWNANVYVPYRLQFKFVCSTKEDVAEVEKLLDRVTLAHHVFLQVEESKVKDEKLVAACVEVARRKGYPRVIIQQHKFLNLP